MLEYATPCLTGDCQLLAKICNDNIDGYFYLTEENVPVYSECCFHARTMSANCSVNASSIEQKIIRDEDCFVSDSTALKALRISAYCFLIVISLIGNSSIIVLVWKERQIRKTINFFIVNMCVADILTTLFMPRVMALSYLGYEWKVHGLVGLVLCKVLVFTHETAIAVSIFTVVAISCDRFFAVVFPLKTLITKTICRIIIAVIWILAVIIRLPMLYGLKTHYKESGKLSCSLSLDSSFHKGAEKSYYKFILILVFAAPLSVIVVLYSGILITLKLRRIPGDEITRRNPMEKSRDAAVKKKVLRLVLILVAVFVLCWLLYFIWLILFSYKIRVSCGVKFFRLYLAHLNSALNPCLYYGLNENFRKGLRNGLNRCLLGGCISGNCMRMNAVNPDLRNQQETRFTEIRENVEISKL